MSQMIEHPKLPLVTRKHTLNELLLLVHENVPLFIDIGLVLGKLLLMFSDLQPFPQKFHFPREIEGLSQIESSLPMRVID